jgi:hypothetical protein
MIPRASTRVGTPASIVDPDGLSLREQVPADFHQARDCFGRRNPLKVLCVGLSARRLRVAHSLMARSEPLKPRAFKRRQRSAPFAEP